jgi:hypothetical protein
VEVFGDRCCAGRSVSEEQLICFLLWRTFPLVRTARAKMRVFLTETEV